MPNGEADMFFSRWDEVVVLLERPRTAAFSCQTERRMGIESVFSAGPWRDVRSRVGSQEKADIQSGQRTLARDG